MPTAIVFETHSWSEDNDRGVATGWLPGRLSERGRHLAAELGERRRNDGITAVFTSDLRRAAETAEIAFQDSNIPILLDWRLRECDYGTSNGMPAAELHEHRDRHLDEPYPSGESWRQAIERVGGFVNDIPTRWANQRILLIGHVATRWALDHLVNSIPLEALMAADFAWREGWEYELHPS
ncbi:histidine phosphatase family protein [Actinoplanes sp. TRM 88003]|uniref:Histidine phosphatase family protein n=1 Tax=Paractinoplanes aksuensis TaxID=2939490 RepID=A0ABT1DFI0_9ACTN|nr:histidine phosphatase family protein [Actinoplanes aksuensis]MCO8269583.1 histidine phosphatase family protein [Actinoplanes aksuensis]